MQNDDNDKVAFTEILYNLEFSVKVGKNRYFISTHTH